MVNYTRKKGGKFIARGTYGCVFGPPLKCKENSERMNNSHVSKLMRQLNAEDEYKESQGVWSKIDPEQNFSLSAVKICGFDERNLKASNEFEKCKERNERETLLIYKNGGLDLSKLKPHPKNYKPLFKDFLNLMKGLEVAHENNVVHCDIKTPNIVAAIKGNSFKLRFIDYGLSKDVTYLEEYDLLFVHNDSFYEYWPFEFGCFYDNGYLISKSDMMERLYEYNNRRPESSHAYSLGAINIYPDEVYDIIRDADFDGNENIKRTYKGLDVYSMGVVLANLLFEYFSVSFLSLPDGSLYPFYYDMKTEKHVRYNKLSEKTELTEKQIEFHNTVLEHIVTPLAKLIENMTHIYPVNRYKIGRAIEDYEKLIPVFDKYLNAKEVSEGLENQLILNKKPDIPYIKTPTPMVRSPSRKNNSPRKFFKPIRSLKIRTSK